MRQVDLLAVLLDFWREKTALYQRHLAVARVAGHYDINNTYQYIIAREEQHIDWVREAILQTGGNEPEVVPYDALTPPRDAEGLRALARTDAAALASFVDAFRPRVHALPNARHRLMLELTLGEMLEHSRLLQQAADGREDLLGRRTGGTRPGGHVMSARWVE